MVLGTSGTMENVDDVNHKENIKKFINIFQLLDVLDLDLIDEVHHDGQHVHHLNGRLIHIVN